MSLTEIMKVAPHDRLIGHWSILVDWDLQRQRPYVIVDPYDPEGLLYLTRSEYLSQMKVCASNDLTLFVVARPGTKKPTPVNSPQNSPTLKGENFDSITYFQDKNNRLTWKAFLQLRNSVSRNVKVDDGMVTVQDKTSKKSSLMIRTVVTWIRSLLHYATVKVPEARIKGMNPFVQALGAVTERNGVAFAAKRMKISLFAVYSYLAGNPLETTDPLGLRIRLRSGLPESIPRAHRDLIRSGNMKWIRIWLSVLNIYRSLQVKTPDPETAYKTIRQAKPPLQEQPLWEDWKYFCKEIWPMLLAMRSPKKSRPYYQYKDNRGLLIRSAAVNLSGSASVLGLILDARAWAKAPQNHPLEWFKFHGDEGTASWMQSIADEPHYAASQWVKDPVTKEFVLQDAYEDYLEKIIDRAWRKPDGSIDREQYKTCLNAARAAGGFIGHCFDASKPAREVRSIETPITGRLFNFDAPGGKLRTVAICDYWTQLAMKSVHDYLFEVLKLFGDNDATFDQQGTVDKYHAKGYRDHHSFDLSAATDSISIDLYIECLATLFMKKGETYEQGHERAVLWSRLMTDRDFAIPSPRKGEVGYTGTTQYRTIRYGTGQPMGALSSWAALAVIHHALVQFASWRAAYCPRTHKPGSIARVMWFESYLVLGDDLDISGEGSEAREYMLVCDRFSITIGISKSLQSRENFFEFANQRFNNEGNISPLSFLEELTSSESWNRRTEFVRRIVKRFDLKPSEENLVRLVCTPKQWQALIPEYSGMRSHLILRFLRFILLNPLRPLWEGDKRVRIDAIKNWLANLKQVVAGQASTGRAVRFENALAALIKEEVQSRVNRMKAEIPPSTTRYGYEQKLEIFYSSINEGFRCNQWKPVPGRPHVLPKAMFAWSYFEYCVNRFNERLHKDIRTFEMQNWKLLSLKMHIVHLAPDPSEFTEIKEVDLSKWIDLYLAVGNFPRPIVFNYENMRSVLHTEVDETSKMEHAESLLKLIIPLLGEHFGLEFGALPYFPINGARGGRWTRILRRSLARFVRSERAIAACPNPTGLRTRWFSDGEVLE